MKNSILAVVLLPLAACDGSLSGLTPTIAFDRLDVDAVAWDSADTQFVFRVENPNPVDITLASFDYNLAFEGVEWLSGDDPDGLELSASDASEVSLPVSLIFADLYDMVQATRGEDTVDFELAGSFGFNTPLGVIQLPYDAGGGFPALRTPTLSFNKVRVEEWGPLYTSATVALDLNIDNDHESNLSFTNFDYGLSLAGVDIAAGQVANLGEVEGASTGTLSLPFEVDFLDAGTAVYEALTSSNIKVGLAATSDVDTPFGIVPLSIDESGNVQVD